MKKVPCDICGEPRWPSQHAGAPARPTCQKCRSARVQHGKPNTYKKRGCRCDLCRAAWAAYNSKYAQARRATLRSVPADLVDSAAVYARDGWVCGICELAVDPTEKFPSPGAATLDHVIPISRGGAHTLDNLQCAHFYCNTVKGNRSLEDAC